MTTTERELVKPIPLWRRVNTSTALMLGLLIVVGIFFSVSSPYFLTSQNLINLAMQVSPALIVAIAVTFVITTGEIDLSVGSILAFTGVACASMLSAGLDSALVLPLGLLIGAGWGAINGWVSAYGRIPSFIVTLATMSVIRGIALIMTEGYAISVPSGAFFLSIGQNRLFGFSWATWIALVVVVVGAVLLHSTRFGQYVTGIGSNQESVRRAGVNTKLVKLLAFVFTGAMAGLAGMITTARLASADANAAADFGLTMVTAVVLGGTNLLGGRGSIVGTVIGSVLVGALANGLTLLKVNPYVTPILTGTILVVVILVNLRGSDTVTYFRRLVSRP
jgi:simple sugar transport system permease protein